LAQRSSGKTKVSPVETSIQWRTSSDDLIFFLDLEFFDSREVGSRETFRFVTDCAPAAPHRSRGSAAMA
jgi:hypothetical protein